MGNKFWNKTNIYGLAGALSWVITVLVLFIPFKGDSTVSLVQWDSPLGIVVIALSCIVAALYFIAILKHDKVLSFNDKKALLEERGKILPKLQTAIDNRLKAALPLKNKAEKYPLSKYWEDYLRYTLRYIGRRNKPKSDQEISNQLFNKGFMLNNLYYQDLKEQDGNYKRSVECYNLVLSQVKTTVNDKELVKRLNYLWRMEHWCRSTQIYATIKMSNKKIPNIPLGYHGGLWGKHTNEQGFQGQLEFVKKRITELMEANDL